MMDGGEVWTTITKKKKGSKNGGQQNTKQGDKYWFVLCVVLRFNLRRIVLSLLFVFPNFLHCLLLRLLLLFLF